MLNTIISKLIGSKTVSEVPAEIIAADSISTLEKANARLQEIRAAFDAPGWTSQRRGLLRAQEREINKAIAQMTMTEKRLTITEVMDKAVQSIRAAQDKSKIEQRQIQETLSQSQKKIDTLKSRADKIESIIKKEQSEAEEKYTSLKDDFNKAIASGDEDAEMKASENLYTAKTKIEQIGVVDSPLKIRHTAICKEMEAEAVNLNELKIQLENVTQNVLKAGAEIALIEYDRQINILIDAYIRQFECVRMCSMKTANTLKTINVDFIPKGSNPDNLLISHLGFENALHYIGTPDLSILAQKAEDLPLSTMNGNYWDEENIPKPIITTSPESTIHRHVG